MELEENNYNHKKINDDEESLYENHIIKEELVIGPEVIQYPDNTTAYETTKFTAFKENVLENEETNLKEIKTEVNMENLYDNHIIKEELVIREEIIQKPHAAIPESFTGQDNKENKTKKATKIGSKSLAKNIVKDKLVKETKTIKKVNANTTKSGNISINQKELEANASRTEQNLKENQSSPKPYTHKCHICHKTFTHATNLSRHEKIIHLGLKPYTCIKCGETFKYIASYKNHVSKHGPLVIKDAVRKVVCKFCNSKMADRRTCDRHEQYYCINNKNRQIRPTKLLQFVCDVCLKSYKRKHSLEVHMGLHFGSTSPKFHCDYCSKKYSRKLNLKFHVQAKHLEQKDYSCLKCGKRFTRRWCLIVHKCLLN